MSDGVDRARVFESQTSAELIAWEDSEPPLVHRVASMIASALESCYPNYDGNIVTEAQANATGSTNCLVTAMLCHRAVTRIGRSKMISGIGIDGHDGFHAYAVIGDLVGNIAVLDWGGNIEMARVRTDVSAIIERRSLVLDPLSRKHTAGLTWRAQCTDIDSPSETACEMIGCTPYRASETLDKMVDGKNYELMEVIARGSVATTIFDHMQTNLHLDMLGRAVPRPLIQDKWLRMFIKNRRMRR